MTGDSALKADVVNCLVERGTDSVYLVLSAVNILRYTKQRTASLGSVPSKERGSKTNSMTHCSSE